MEIELQVVPDSVRFRGFESDLAVSAPAAAMESTTTTPAGAGGSYPLLWTVGVILLVGSCLTLYFHHQQSKSTYEKEPTRS